MGDVLNVAVLLSGGGRTLENLLEHIRHRALPVRVVAVASNKPEARGVRIAGEAGLPVRSFPLSTHEGRSARDAAMLEWLHRYDPRLFVLAGYLALLDLTGSRGLPVLNIHPALLPRHGGKGCYGDRVHAAVLEAGERESGCTVHLVDAEYDRGRILAQSRVTVEPGDTVARLAARVFAAECELYPRVLRDIAQGRLRIQTERAGGDVAP